MAQVQSPPEYKPFYLKIKVRDDGKVIVRTEEKNLLLYFMSSAAMEKLTDELVETYRLIWKNWGLLDRKCVFRLLGIPYMETTDRADVKAKLATSIGSRLTDVAVAVEQYLATWMTPSVKILTQKCHEQLAKLVPMLYQCSAKLLSNGYYTKNKEFLDAVTLAVHFEREVRLLYNEQIKLGSTISNKDRLGWLNELMSQATILREGLRGVVGKRATTSMFSRL